MCERKKGVKDDAKVFGLYTGGMGRIGRSRFGVEGESCSFGHVMSLRYLLGSWISREKSRLEI